MDLPVASHLKDSERLELEAVLAALAHTPRLESFLRYIGERYFQNRIGEINEYNIATEVLGRSKNIFDSSRDSIARVEAHRLRKKLKEYYDSDGKDHEIQISLPSGSYVPAFTCRLSSFPITSLPEAEADDQEVENLPSGIGEDAEQAQASPQTGIAISLGTIRFLSRAKSGNQPGAGTSLPPNGIQPSLQNAAQVPLRLLAGYDGTPKIDSAGVYWQPDRYFHGGGAFRCPDVPVARTSDPMLFEHWRTGDFTYDIPLAPGPYELHLFFVASPQDDPKYSFFNVSVNGKPLLIAFNIGMDALGANIADERVFKDTYPDKDGVLHLKFVMDRSSPTLNALEILPGLPHRQLPIRIVMQRTAVTDHIGNIWHPDDFFQDGMLSDPPRQIGNTPDPGLYAQERYGHFSYSIPVDTRGRYTLVLHFAELYWVPNSFNSVGVGSRVFRVYCNGSTLLDNFDIFKEAGTMHALTKTFNHLRPSAEGKLDLTFEPIVNYATISAIEVIDESE